MQSTSREGKQKVAKISGHEVEQVHVCADFWASCHPPDQTKTEPSTSKQTDPQHHNKQKEITRWLYPNVNKHSQVWDFPHKQSWKIKLKSKNSTYISKTTPATIPHKGKDRHSSALSENRPRENTILKND